MGCFPVLDLNVVIHVGGGNELFLGFKWRTSSRKNSVWQKLIFSPVMFTYPSYGSHSRVTGFFCRAVRSCHRTYVNPMNTHLSQSALFFMKQSRAERVINLEHAVENLPFSDIETLKSSHCGFWPEGFANHSLRARVWWDFRECVIRTANNYISLGFQWHWRFNVFVCFVIYDGWSAFTHFSDYYHSTKKPVDLFLSTRLIRFRGFLCCWERRRCSARCRFRKTYCLHLQTRV